MVHVLGLILFVLITEMNRTLLVEEGDDEGTDNRLDKKKKDKEKLQEIAGGYKCLSNIKVINHDRF